MKTRKLLATVMALGVLGLGAGHALASPFTNGNFAQPGSGSYGVFSSPTLYAGWTYSNAVFGVSNVDQYQGPGAYGLSPANGSAYISFGGDSTYGGSLTQTFDTVAGQAYTVAWQEAEIQGDNTAQDLKATVVNGSQTFSNDFNPSVVGQLVNDSIGFTAQGSSATITFLDATPNDVSSYYSNVALANVSVNGSYGSAAPEPSTWAMMLLGVSGLGMALRRRTVKLQTA